MRALAAILVLVLLSGCVQPPKTMYVCYNREVVDDSAKCSLVSGSGGVSSETTTTIALEPESQTAFEGGEQPEARVDFGQASALPYSNKAYGLELMYPEDWVVREQVLGMVAAFISPKTGETDFQENLNVGVDVLPPEYPTLDSYVNASVKQISMIVTDYFLEDYSKTTLAANSAYRLVYTGRQGQFKLKWMQVYAARKGKVYVFTYTAEEKDYDNTLPTIQAMLSSVKID